MNNNISDEDKIDFKDILKFIIWSSIGVILGCLLIISYEYYDAKKNCEKIEGEYSFKKSLFSGTHYCNNKPFYKYHDFWDYEREIKNFTINQEPIKKPIREIINFHQ